MLHFCNTFVIGDKLFEKNSDMLRNDSIELLNRFSSHFLIVFDYAVDVIAANTDLIEDELEE